MNRFFYISPINEDETQFVGDWARVSNVIEEEYDQRIEVDISVENMCKCSINKFISMLENGFDVNNLKTKDSFARKTLLTMLVQTANFDKISILLDFNDKRNIIDINKNTDVFFNLADCYREGDDRNFMILDKLLLISNHIDLEKLHSEYNYTLLVNSKKYNTPLECYRMTLNNVKFQYPNEHNHISFIKQMILIFENHIQNSKTLFSLMLSEIE